ncbi:extracellular solute-binding protein [Candidatus Bipolaricaulota bacterium]|nr:extracellular solute-binding protein [Candidatus Bipolaricaulota bacterium]
MKKTSLVSVSLIVMFLLMSFTLVPSVSAQNEQVTLNLWDIYNRPTQQPIVKKAIKEFESRHPNVEIKRSVAPLEDMKVRIMSALKSKKGPDLFIVNNGENMMGPVVRGGHLLSLDKYAQKYNWEEKLMSLDTARYTEDGTTFGKGNLYGVPFQAEYVGVYYNKSIFEKYNLSEPESLQEMEEVCQNLKEEGVTPIAVGLLDDWQFFHLFGEIQNSVLAHYMGADLANDYLNDLILSSAEDRTWDNGAQVRAAKIAQEWAEKGYLIDGFSGLKGDDAMSVFAAGKAAMFVQGIWYAGSISEKIDAGFFLFPSYEKGEGIPPQVGGVGVPLGISNYSDHPDLAAEFIDILATSKFTADISLEKGALPAKAPIEQRYEEGTLNYDIVQGWNKVNKVDRLVPYLDWATPTMWDTMAPAGRKLMKGEIEPEKFVEKIEEDYQKWLEKKPQ